MTSRPVLPCGGGGGGGEQEELCLFWGLSWMDSRGLMDGRDVSRHPPRPPVPLPFSLSSSSYMREVIAETYFKE